MDKPFLSVVIPSYNERRNLERDVLEQVVEDLKKQSYTWEIVLTDDGSTDGTTKELHRFAQAHPNVRVVENLHRGKGPTVASGMLAADGQYRLFSDFDQSTPIADFERFLPFIEDGYDVVIGSRAVQGAKREQEPFHRHLMGKVFNVLVQTIAVPGIHDTQCGFKMFSAKATEQLFPKLVIYQAKERKDAFTGAFDVELLLLARRAGYEIAEVPVAWVHNETQRVSPLKDSVRMFGDILRIRWAALTRRYEKT
jgi:glycosyltransferase involved in cell wall biosynthesis